MVVLINSTSAESAEAVAALLADDEWPEERVEIIGGCWQDVASLRAARVEAFARDPTTYAFRLRSCASTITAIQDEAATRGDMGFPVEAQESNAAESAAAIRSLLLEEISIADPDPHWPAQYAAERQRLAGALGERAVAIEHVGSTAVPGLAAKPIIDILVSVASLDACAECIVPLATLGYSFLDYPQNVERKFFRRGVPRTHHLHLVTRGGSEEAAHLDFRDALRADPAARDEYVALKRSLAAGNAQRRAAYGDGKSAFIARVLERARLMGRASTDRGTSGSPRRP